ncbi:MAG: efflux RND transporter permease subunit [Acidobacteria bacterium]|nr:efflux RND transporter permease subunit [Acidobacteriota bacterium]
MWIVRLALSRPYTFVVISLLIAILGGAAIVTMPVDIFPYIDIPVVSVVWQYSGLSPEEMEKRIVTIFERAVTTTVNDIEHIESQSINGVSVVRLYFQPNVKVEMAVAQVTALSQSILRPLPPGVFPPSVLKYDASSVPILQLGLESNTLAEQEISDLGNNYIRTQLATIQGAAVASPLGGKFRLVMVDLNPEAMFARGLTASDISLAFGQQNLILPAGTAKFGDTDYQIKLNSSPRMLEEMNRLPVKVVNGATVFLGDVANVRDGYSVQGNIVRANGKRGALITVLRNGKASTIAIVNGVKKELPRIIDGLPTKALKVTELFDQSLFVRAAVNGVVREALMAAGLTGLMILLFLGSWRSTLIVCISIPLSILASLSILSLLGQTINVMTLGGMALAVGILVDDATVAIENIHRNMRGKPLVRAVLDGAHQIATPAFVSTLSICIVFVPVLLLTGAARFLFTPLAMAVVFAMMASYFLSRTLVPTMAHHMLKSEALLYASGHDGEAEGGKGIIWSAHRIFNRGFEAMRESYASMLEWLLDHAVLTLAGFALFVAGSLTLAPMVGRDFFPSVDTGQLRLHARAPAGTRIETTEQIFAAIEREIHNVIPPEAIATIIDNIGLPQSGVNLAMGDVPTIGVSDGEILISLRDNVEHEPVSAYTEKIRKRLNEKFPDMTFFFEPANITNQILNFGLPAPIDVQVIGRNQAGNFKLAQELERRIQRIPGAADVHIHQVVDAPEIRIDVNRARAGAVGLMQRDVTNSLMISLSSSSQLSPTQWLDWTTGISYSVSIQTPQYRINSLEALMRTPVGVPTGGINATTSTSLAGASNANASFTGAAPAQNSAAYGNPGTLAGGPQILANLATTRRGEAPAVINHYNVQPVFDVYCNIDRRDLGSVSSAVQKIVDDMSKKLPLSTRIEMRGQAQTMQSSFYRLGLGMIFAVVLVYLVMAVNFQSWLDPFIILMALPGALAGIVWILFVTQTTFSVPSLMGSIMCIGVATANSILLVVFANDERLTGLDARAAALSAGHTRIRPVMMTAGAMIIGMLPMALGIGEGGEQNAPLGRAVIGGLALATITTLMIVPVVYKLLRKKPPVDFDERLSREEMEHSAMMPEELI